MSPHAVSVAPKTTQKLKHLYRALVAGVLSTLPSTAHAGEMSVVPQAPSVVRTEADAVGSLVIAGGGDLPQSIYDRFIELAGEENAHIVIIPTASVKADEQKDVRSHWRGGELRVKSAKLLHTRNPATANDPAFAEPLETATGVWIGGGIQSRLSEAYDNTLIEQRLKEVFARGGVIGGTSAGAAVMSPRMITGGKEIARIGNGLDLAPAEWVIDQHFMKRNRRSRLESVLKTYPECTGIGIDEETALVIRGRIAKVIGNANVWICSPQGDTKTLGPGAQEDIANFSVKTAVSAAGGR